MMISTQYCLTMARYNAWQNKQLKACFEKMDKAELEQDRGGFFGSIYLLNIYGVRLSNLQEASFAGLVGAFIVLMTVLVLKSAINRP